MLILTRYVGEEIIAGEHGEIRIMLVGFKNGQARIGISAPSNVPIDRKEIHDRKQKQGYKKAA